MICNGDVGVSVPDQEGVMKVEFVSERSQV